MAPCCRPTSVLLARVVTKNSSRVAKPTRIGVDRLRACRTQCRPRQCLVCFSPFKSRQLQGMAHLAEKQRAEPPQATAGGGLSGPSAPAENGHQHDNGRGPNKEKGSHFADAHGGNHGSQVVNHSGPLTFRHLWKPPVVRQWIQGGKLYKEAGSRQPARLELFFDLAYAGIVHQLAENASEAADAIGVSRSIAQAEAEGSGRSRHGHSVSVLAVQPLAHLGNIAYCFMIIRSWPNSSWSSTPLGQSGRMFETIATSPEPTTSSSACTSS